MEVRFTHEDFASVRFAHSPVSEVVASLRLLQNSRQDDVYRGWRAAVSRRMGGLDMPLLTALVGTKELLRPLLPGHVDQPHPTLRDELLAALRSLPGHSVRDELDRVRRGRPLPASLEPLYANPTTELPRIVNELMRYWQATLAPFWAQIKAIVRGDIEFRTEQFAIGGLASIFNNLHPNVRFVTDRLFIDGPRLRSPSGDLTGRGLVLAPCAFLWPTVEVNLRHGGRPSLSYPPRGITRIGDEAPSISDDPFEALVGRAKLNVLLRIEHPKTTTELAAELGLSAPAVSQHLKTLKSTNLVTSRRQGRKVFYRRTDTATAILNSFVGICTAA